MKTFHAHFSLVVLLRPDATREQIAEVISPVFPILGDSPPAAALGRSAHRAHAWLDANGDRGDRLHLFHSMPVHASFEQIALDPVVRSLGAFASQPFVVSVIDCDLAVDAPPVITLIGGLATLMAQLSPVSELLAVALEAASLTNDAGLRESLLTAAGVFSTTRTTQAWTVADVQERSDRDLTEWEARSVLARMQGIDETTGQETERFDHFLDEAIDEGLTTQDADDATPRT